MNDGDIKISIRPDCVEVDLCSEEVRKRGGSAVNQYVKTPRNTEVYFGNLHARVTMFDVGICVVMDPRPGEWHDGTWARGAAIAALTSAAHLCDQVSREATRAAERKAAKACGDFIWSVADAVKALEPLKWSAIPNRP